MYNEKQTEIIERIKKNFEILLNEKSGALPFFILDAYKSDISLLCSDEYFTPEVLNFAMDIMWRISNEYEKDDRMALSLLRMHTYERFRIRPESKEKNGHPY